MLKVVKLTLEDAKESVVWSGEYYQHLAKRLLQSLQQPTEIEVEIVMGATPIWENADVQGHVVCKKCGEWQESQIKPYKCKCSQQPKLDSEGCIVLRKL
jgi:hypothetical protein